MKNFVAILMVMVVMMSMSGTAQDGYIYDDLWSWSDVRSTNTITLIEKGGLSCYIDIFDSNYGRFATIWVSFCTGYRDYGFQKIVAIDLENTNLLFDKNRITTCWLDNIIALDEMFSSERDALLEMYWRR